MQNYFLPIFCIFNLQNLPGALTIYVPAMPPDVVVDELEPAPVPLLVFVNFNSIVFLI